VAIGKVIAGTYDPRTPEGRQAIAAELGVTAALMTVSGPTMTAIRAGAKVGRIRRAAGIVAPVVGASVGGGAAAAGEEFLGTPPPEEEDPAGVPVEPQILDAGGTPIVDADEPTPPASGRVAANILAAAAEEGFYEVAGNALIWVPRAIGRRAVQGKVVKKAIRGLETERLARTDVVNADARANREQVRALSASLSADLRKARNVTAGDLENVGAATRAEVAAAETQSRIGQQAATDRLAASTSSTLRGPAGRQTLDVVNGGAQRVRDELGAAIPRIAETGPDLNILPLKDRAQDIFDREIKARLEAFSGVSGDTLQPQAQALVDQAMQAGVAEDQIANMTKQFLDAGLGVDAAEATIETARSPGLALLRQIINAEDTVTFQAGHQLKKSLDDGINFGVRAQTQPTQLAKAMRSGLADLLNDFTPYADANRAFGRVAQLMDDNAVVAQLKKNAFDNPESLVNTLKPDDSTSMRLLRDLLTTVPTGDVDTQIGRQAWDTVRSAWTHQHLIRKGIENLGKRIDDLDPETAAVLYGDAKGQAIIDNLRQIDAAYREAIQVAAERTAAAQVTGATTKDAIRAAGRGTIDTIQTAGAARRLELGQETEAIKKVRELMSRATPDEQALGDSTLATAQNLTQIQVDIARAVFLAPGGAWQLISTLRLVKGPRGADLIRWASHSPRGTRFLVEAFTSPLPGAGIASLVRMDGFAQFFLNPLLNTAGIRNDPATQTDQTDPFGVPPPISFGEVPRAARLPQSATIGPAGQPSFAVPPPR